MRKLILIILVMSLLALGGCAVQEQPTIPSTTQPTTAPTSPSTAPSDPATEPSGSEQTQPSQPVTEPTEPEPTETKAPTAPDFTVYDKDGKAVKLSDFFGKPIVLNFWSSNCPPCRAEMPDFQKVYLELGDEIQFLMVNMTDGYWDTVTTASNFIKQNGYTFPILYDKTSEAAYTYYISSIPTTIFIDAEGDIFVGVSGMLSEEKLRMYIERIR